MTEAKQSKGRVRRWLDRRREGQLRGAEIAHRAKTVRKESARRAARNGRQGNGDPGGLGSF